MTQLTRRQIMLAMVTGAAVIHGDLEGQQSAQGVRRQILLALDSVDEIIVRYKGRQVALTPAEVMDQLGGK